MMTFNDFNKKYKLKQRATSSRKKQQVLISIDLDNVGIYSGDQRLVNLHRSEGSNWVCYRNENYFDSYG